MINKLNLIDYLSLTLLIFYNFYCFNLLNKSINHIYLKLYKLNMSWLIWIIKGLGLN